VIAATDDRPPTANRSWLGISLIDSLKESDTPQVQRSACLGRRTRGVVQPRVFMATMRNIAISLLRLAGWTNIKRANEKMSRSLASARPSPSSASSPAELAARRAANAKISIAASHGGLPYLHHDATHDRALRLIQLRRRSRGGEVR